MSPTVFRIKDTDFSFSQGRKIVYMCMCIVRKVKPSFGWNLMLNLPMYMAFLRIR